MLEHDGWAPMYNCVTFAVDIWNSLFPLKQFYAFPDYGEAPLPSYLYAQIANCNNYENNIYVSGCTPIGYYDGSTFYGCYN